MKYEISADIVLRKGGIAVLDALGCSTLEAVHEFGNTAVISKRLGLAAGDLAGTIASLERQFREPLVTRDGDELQLTRTAIEAISQFRMKERMLVQQLKNLWEKPWVTTDGIVLVDGKLVLIRRGNEPFKGMYALPGGIVEYGESLEDCVVREVREETGLDVEVLEISGTYSDPDRDPRGHFITIAFNLRHVGGSLQAGDDAAGAYLFPLDELPALAGDHAKIISDALRKRGLSNRIGKGTNTGSLNY